MKKNVLITGGTRGIGRAMVEKFAEAGYNVGFIYEKEDNTASELCETKGSFAVKANVGKYENLREAIIKLKTLMNVSGFDVVISNAGISKTGLFDLMTVGDWQEIIDVNLSGTFYLLKETIPYMISEKSGRIITISSMWGEVGASCEVAYSATKGGIIAMTKALAKELGPSNITVNSIAPGVIKTDMIGNISEDIIEELKDETPLRTIGRPEDIAETALFLASDKASYLTGQIIGVNGGLVI